MACNRTGIQFELRGQNSACLASRFRSSASQNCFAPSLPGAGTSILRRWLAGGIHLRFLPQCRDGGRSLDVQNPAFGKVGECAAGGNPLVCDRTWPHFGCLAWQLDPTPALGRDIGLVGLHRGHDRRLWYSSSFRNAHANCGSHCSCGIWNGPGGHHSFSADPADRAGLGLKRPKLYTPCLPLFATSLSCMLLPRIRRTSFLRVCHWRVLGFDGRQAAEPFKPDRTEFLYQSA